MSQMGSEKIEQNEALGSTGDCKEKDKLEKPREVSTNEKQQTDDKSASTIEGGKADSLKKNETTAPLEKKPASNINAAAINGSTTATALAAIKKVSQSSETDKPPRTTDSDSVLNHPSNGKTDNPLPVYRETPSSLSSANINTSSSGANSFNGSRKSESSMAESRNHSYEQRRSTLENLSKTNLYIRGLSPTTTDDDLYNMCVRFGDILSTKAIIDKTSNCCRGYGFVEYAAAHSAEAAVGELTKGGIQAQMARIPFNNLSHSQRYPYHKGPNNHSHYQPHYQHHGGHSNHHGGGHHNSINQSHNHNTHNHINSNISDPTNLYLANLPLNMSEVELDTLLSSYGPVVSTRILRDERQNSRGVGFARMETRDKCREIIEKLNGKPYKGSGELLLVKFADDGNRKRHNHNFNHQGSNNNHHNHHQQQHHSGNNMHHKQAANDDENRWRGEGGESAEQNVNPPLYEQQRNLTHGDQMSEMTMMNPMSYSRMQTPFPPAMNAAYQAALGPPTTAAQWLHPGSGQTWNVIPHMMQPNNMGPSSQGAVPPNYPFGHMSQITSQMQGLHLGPHSGAPMAGYMPPQWSPVWPHPMSPPQQTQSQQMRMAPVTQAQQIPPVLPEAASPYIGNQEGHQINTPKQVNMSDTNKPIPAPL